MNLSLLLVGRDGNGKSSTGNSILGGKPFTPTSNCSSVGVDIQQASATVSGIKVTVTEVAGLEYPGAGIEGDIEDTLGKNEETITENKNGFNAVIFVLKFGSFTKQEKDALLMIRSIFGSNVVKDFGVVVMTNGDCFDSDEGHDKRTFKEWCQGQTGEVRDLFEDCENRCVLFNNRTKDEGKMEEQRQLVFQMVTNLGHLYTLDEYTKADKSQTEIVVQSKLPKVEQYKKNVMREVWKELDKIDHKYPIVSCDFLELSCLLNNMEEKLLGLKMVLLEEDKNTGVLKQLFYDISVAEMRIHAYRLIVEWKLQILVSSATLVICWFVQSEFDLQKLTETISLKECSIDKDGHICSKSVSGKDKDVSGCGIALIEICKTSSNSQQVTETLDIHDKLSRSRKVNEVLDQDSLLKYRGQVAEVKGQYPQLRDDQQVAKVHGHDPQPKDRKLVAKVPGHAGHSKPKDDLEATKVMFEAIRKQLKHDNLNHDVICLISKYEQTLTKEEIGVVIEKVKTTYGTNEIKNHSILILTSNNDNLEAEKAQMLADWCQEETGANQQLLKACGHRCVLLNPWPKNEGTSSDGGLTRPVFGSGTGNACKNGEVGHPKAQVATGSA